MITFELSPVLPTIDRDPKSKFRPKEKQIGLNQVFFDYMRVTANAFGFLRGHQRSPGLPVVARFEDIRRHVAKGMSLERGIGCRMIEDACLNPVDPRIFR